tara:strand:- start:1768 stop:2115 length:348 start_codon:yes stop_codon:yes gene_type:complete
MFNKLFNLFRGKEKMATANYTQQQTEQMVSKYSANPTRATVDALAKELGKNTRSVIAKLSREGVYIAQPRATKSGEPIVRKAELVAQLEAHFGIEVPTLVKTSKADLQRLLEAVS